MRPLVRLLLLALLLPVASPAAPAARRDEVREALDAIYALVAGRRFAEAREQWNRLAPKLSESLRGANAGSAASEQARQRRAAEAMFVQALLTARLGDRAEALSLLRQADGYGFPPLDSPLMLLAADCLFELEEPALAAQAYQEVVTRAPANLEARLRLGAALLSAGRLDAAETELEQVLRAAPGRRQANFYLGALRFQQRRTGEARLHLERELSLDPQCSGCMAKLAHVAYLEGDDRQCEAWLAKAAALDPDSTEVSLVSGMLASRAGRYQDAVRDLVRAVERAPAYAAARYQLALAYRRAGDAAKAREHLDVYERLIEEEKARTIGVRGGAPESP